VFELLALVVSIGLVDSLNPATIVPALYFASGTRPTRTTAGFGAGVLLVNLAGGVALVLGPGQAVLAAVPRPDAAAKHLLELACGIVALGISSAAWLLRGRIAAHFARGQERIQRASPIVGATIAAVELPTAVPYFAVIAAIVGSGRRLTTELGLLALFNLTFVAPILAIAVLSAASTRHTRRIHAIRARLIGHGGALVAAVLLGVSLLLVAVGAFGLLH
jgi:cytochrome c biogenesis protein CcdA